MAKISKYIIAILTLAFLLPVMSCNAQSQSEKNMNEQKDTLPMTKNKDEQLACKLTSPELRERKETVIASLKKQILDRKELLDGYAFKFPGSDEILDGLTEFVKTERACCSFFVFTISVSGDKSEIWLQITGTKGAKEFIISELGF